jgi:hypothetical protein
MTLCHLAQSNDWHVVNQANEIKTSPLSMEHFLFTHIIKISVLNYLLVVGDISEIRNS